MRSSRKRLVPAIWTILFCAYFTLVLSGFFSLKDSFHLLLILVLNLVVALLGDYFANKKIERLKKALGITENLPLEALEQLKIEHDYQEKYVRKWVL